MTSQVAIDAIQEVFKLQKQVHTLEARIKSLEEEADAKYQTIVEATDTMLSQIIQSWQNQLASIHFELPNGIIESKHLSAYCVQNSHIADQAVTPDKLGGV